MRLASATSSPKTTMRGLRAISSFSVRLIAPTMVSGFPSGSAAVSNAEEVGSTSGEYTQRDAVSFPGCGAFSVVPRLMVQVCHNGLVVEQAALRRTHLGARHTDDGVIAWSEETNTKTLELITSRTKDAVAAYLDRDFVARMLRDLQTEAGKPVVDPDTTIKVVAQRLRYSDEQQKCILAHFVLGGDLSAGGVMHAVTSVAQTLADADAAYDLENSAVQAMRIAATT